MDITEKDLQEQYYKTINGAIRTPIFTYDEFDQATGTYKNIVIIKTADEAYQESLNPVIPQPTLEERLASAEKMLTMLMGV